MRFDRYIGKTVATTAVIFALAACQTTDNRIELNSIVEAEQVLDKWGSVTASVPVISIPSDDFKFALNKTTEQYYDNAKQEINAGIAQHTQTVFSFMLAASSQNDVLNQDAFSEKLTQYEAKLKKAQAKPELSEEEQATLKADAAALIAEYKLAAKANFDTCKDVADFEQEAAKNATTTEEKLRLTTSSVDRRQSCLDSYQAELATLNPTATMPQYPGYPENNVPALSRIQNTPFLAQQGLSDTFSSKDNAIMDSAFAIPDHTAIPQAATNKFLSDMFKSISDNKDKSAYFGVTMVSVNPGWRTSENYKAVINIEPAIVYERASKSTTDAFLANEKIDKTQRAALATSYYISCKGFDFEALCDKNKQGFMKQVVPFFPVASYKDLLAEKYDVNTTAISPVTYGQTFDLQNRQISQINLSLMLAASLRAAGVGEAAEIFTSYSRERRKEFGSKNSLNNVSVFSSGKTVGVEISPEFFAANPDNNNSEEKLQAQTFPMLIRFEASDREDWKAPSIAVECDGNAETYDICLMEPKFQFVTTPRWKIKEMPFFRALASKTINTEDLFNIKSGVADDCQKYRADVFVDAKCEELTSKIFGTRSFVSLPKFPEKTANPSFSHIHPKTVTIKRDKANDPIVLKQQFVLSGEHLQQLRSVDLSQHLDTLFDGQNIKKASLVGGSIVVDMEISKADGPLIFSLKHADYTLSTGSTKQAIAQIAMQAKRAPSKTVTPAQFSIVQDKDNGAVKVTLPPGNTDIPENTGKVIESLFNQKGNGITRSGSDNFQVDIQARLGCSSNTNLNTNTAHSVAVSDNNVENCHD